MAAPPPSHVEGKHSDGKEKDGEGFGEHGPRVPHQIRLKCEEKGDPDGLCPVVEQPFREEEREVDRDHAEHKRDQAASKLHIGYEKVERRDKKG